MGYDPEKNEDAWCSSNFGASTNENDWGICREHSDDPEPFYDTVGRCHFCGYDFFYSLGEFDYLADIREYLPEELHGKI